LVFSSIPPLQAHILNTIDITNGKTLVLIELNSGRKILISLDRPVEFIYALNQACRAAGTAEILNAKHRQNTNSRSSLID
jgi:hypothetical protein